MSLILAIALALLLAAPVQAAPKPKASCSVSPNPTTISADGWAYFTVTWTANEPVTVVTNEPPPGPSGRWAFEGSGSLDWLTAYSGNGSVDIIARRNQRVLASCSFVVLTHPKPIVSFVVTP